MYKKLSNFIDVSFFIRFLVILIPLNYFHILYLGITDPQNFYLPFFDINFNYIKWITYSINYTARWITHLFGINAGIYNKLIYVKGSEGVLLEFSCLGLGIMSFWIAFVLAHKNSIKNKLIWTITGLVSIWFLNTWRIALLLTSLVQKWKGSKLIDHHDLFNYASYIIIAFLIYLFYKSNKQMEEN